MSIPLMFSTTWDLYPEILTTLNIDTIQNLHANTSFLEGNFKIKHIIF